MHLNVLDLDIYLTYCARFRRESAKYATYYLRIFKITYGHSNQDK